VRAVEKPKVGIFSMSSCEGCLVQVLNLEDKILEMMRCVELVDCRLLGVKKSYDRLDIAIVEGAVMSDEEERELREIRERSKILVALGDCACHGGRFLFKDFKFDGVPVDLPRGIKSFRADPLDKYVKVDYYVYGCPIDGDDFLRLFKELLMGKEYRPAPFNVCAECILKDNECLLDRGVPCLGPITRGGCGAVCPTSGRRCIGCRGLAEDANIDSLIEIFTKRGIEVPEYLWELKKRVGGGGRG